MGVVRINAEPDSTLRAIMGSSFGCAGQRCMAGSVLMGVGKSTADEWRERVVSAIDDLQIGVNVGVPAPMALFSFSGWNDSFYGDLHMDGVEGVMFYTRQKCILSRWDSSYVRATGW